MAAHVELVLLFLLIVVAAFSTLARVVGLPFPILLVIGGSLVGFAPGVPEVELPPDLVLLLFLPPLLFNAAYFSSLRDLRENQRAIALSAFGLVLVTAGAVAAVARIAVPELSWAAAFALGAIVSPTDPLAATTIARRLGVPRRLTTIIEGESLINDGSALVIYRVAVAAAVGGSFDLLDASLDFVVNVVGGILVGLVAATALIWVFRRIASDHIVVIVISLCAGYLGYLPAEELGVSGVLAAVTVGLLVGNRSPTLSTAATRLRGFAFWEVLVFILNATLFTLVGLQLPGILEDQDRSAGALLGLALLVCAVVIGTRLVWLNTVPYVIRALDRRASVRYRRAGWRQRLVVGWSGLRGAVSLAAALALPNDFPERDLIVFLTLAVIFATLVVQGLTLPWLIRVLGVEDDGASEREELEARAAATEAALAHLERLRGEAWARDGTVERLQGLYEFRRRRIAQWAREDALGDGDEDLESRSRDYQRLVREVLEAQRARIVALRDEGRISDEVMHTIERELDLEDQRLEV